MIVESLLLKSPLEVLTFVGKSISFIQPSISGIKLFLRVIFLIGLAACSTGSKVKLYRELSKEAPKNIYYEGHYKVGGKYKIKGTTCMPQKDINDNQVGMASWYGGKDRLHGKKTANGDKYNRHLLTAAHTSLPLPSLIKVTNLANYKSLILMVNDRGPFCRGRIIDVSEKAAEILGFKRLGVSKVRVQYMHNETKEFLGKIVLRPQENSIAKKKTINDKCSINCHVKLVNLKHKLAFTP